MGMKSSSENLERPTVNMVPCESGSHKKKQAFLAIFSLILAFSGLLSFFIFIHCLWLLNPIYKTLKILTISFSSSSIALAIVSCTVIALKKRKLKCRFFATISLVISASVIILSGALPVTFRRGKRLVVQSNLHKLHAAVMQYVEANDGYLPFADQWCDLLMKQDENLSKDIFRYPPGKYGIFIFAFNKNLNGLRLNEVPEDIVLIFEHDGVLDPENNNSINWNLAGGAEVLEKSLENRQEYYVLLASGNVYASTASLRDLFGEKLRWKP